MDDVLEQLRRLRRTMLADVHELESGLRRHSEKQDGEWVDITPQLIKAWRDEAQQLEKLILAYEHRSGLELPRSIAI
jgi:hypothetical protein